MLKTERLLETVFLLLDKRKVTAEALAARFGVSKRTVLRDMESLALAGIPLYGRQGKEGGFSLMDTFVLDKSLLTAEEQKEILSALETMKPFTENHTEKLLVKLKGIFSSPEARTDWLEVDFSRWGKKTGDTEKFNLLKTCILKRQPIAFVYSGTSGKTESRQTYPLKLVFKKNTWYLQGFCPDKNDYRIFKLNRLRELSVLPGSFEDKYRPPLLDNPEYILENPATNPPDTSNPNPPDTTMQNPPVPVISLTLQFSPEAAYRVYDEFEPEEIKRNDDGSFTVEVSYPETDWVYGYILSFGSTVTVISPRKAAEIIKSRSEKIFQKYL
ncbi:MAG: YafY family transcriptional regulator [Candidatus Treponema excrementipullorum]|uniref:YafY family transcriptional regulator n=1 Tax=Candidatus Treponema excrementipullorum TaxID=2838768 RepID=A0A9E2L1X4_9SPIR|nr:YafY family transcriptional regulator [Candidatus Treponema excrementipullorum]